LTKVRQGLTEVGGQDVAQPEYTERQWAYYPAGHYAAGLLQTEFDANWDGSSTDTHRTDYEYKIWTTTYATCCGHTVSSKNPLGHGSVTNQNAGGLTVHTAGIADVDSHTTLLNPMDNKTLQETTTKYDALGRSVATTVWLQPLGLVDVNNPPIAGFGGVAGTQGLTTQTLYDADLTDNSWLETTTGITVTNPLEWVPSGDWPRVPSLKRFGDIPQHPVCHCHHQARSALRPSASALKVSPENLLAIRTRT
jgi:hypothetical protein